MDVIPQLASSVNEAYNWAIVIGISVCAAGMAIALISWVYSRG
jgi:hypothetical protein